MADVSAADMSTSGAGGTIAASNSNAASATAAVPEGVLKVKIKAARFVATWRWAVADPDDVCGICRTAFESCCPTCKVPGDDCPPMLGVCKHAFHMHCIVTWLQAKDKEHVCPLCRREWDLDGAPPQ